VADFGAIVHWREPDNPVKDGALSQPFFSLPQALARNGAFRFGEKAPLFRFGEKEGSAGGKVKKNCRKALTRVQTLGGIGRR
jgi:hypothetical protein